MRRLSQNKFMGIVFFAVLFVIAAASDYNLMNFYINDITNYTEWTVDMEDALETDYISNFCMKMQFVNLNGLVCRIFGQQEMNNVIKLNNGYLDGTWGGDLADDSVLETCADNVANFQNYLGQKGISYFYVTVPYVVDKYDQQLPVGVGDHLNADLDQMQEKLIQRNVECLDLREALHEDGLETYDIFYKTDHHWTTKGGFWAFQKITEYMEQQYGYEVDDMVMDINNYDITTYENWHLGSTGQRTGIYYAGIDDFDLIVPQFQTELLRISDWETGSFEELIYDTEPLSNKQYANRYTYDTVLQYADDGFYNPNAPIDKTVLIIGDSMSLSVMPYMALIYKNVIFYADYEDVSLINDIYLDTYKPDIVISMYFGTHLGEVSPYNFYSNQLY